MSRFGDNDGEGMPWGLWETVVSNALGGRKGQEALAAMEEALLALPDQKLVYGHLAADGKVCAIGAYVAQQRAEREGVDLATVIEAMSVGLRCWCGHNRDAHSEGICSERSRWKEAEPCGCEEYEPEHEDAYETAEAGRKAGLGSVVAWHLAYLNDESFAGASEEERYESMLAWVRRAQGKPEAAHA